MPAMPPPRDDPRSDDELVDAANRGDAGAFEALYERYINWSLALALRFTRDHETARDVAHDAFLWLLRKFPGFELRAKMTTVLYPAVRNLALTKRRRAQPQSLSEFEIDDDAPDEGSTSLKRYGPAGGELDALASAVDKLPVGQREALLLRFADDLSMAEIATVLEIPAGTVKSRLHNALETLRADPALKKYFENE